MKQLKYFSQLTPKQKDETHRIVCDIIAHKNPAYLSPTLWKMLFDVAFDDIMTLKNEADKYCIGKCFKYKNTWIPLSIVKI